MKATKAKEEILKAIESRAASLGTEQNILLLAQAYQAIVNAEYTAAMINVERKKCQPSTKQ